MITTEPSTFFTCNQEDHVAKFSSNDNSFSFINNSAYITTSGLAPQKACYVKIGESSVVRHENIDFEKAGKLFKSINNLLPFL